MKEKFAFIIVFVIGSSLFMLENPFGLAVGVWAMAAAVIAALIEVAGWLTARKSLVIVPVFGKPKMPLEGPTPVEAHRATRRAESRIVEPASWADYVGPAALAAELRTLSRLIFDPNAGNALGVEVPLGGILHGPPGSGKTLLARVLAGETGRRLLAFDGGALTSMWRGESTQLIRDMFMQARDCTPCILFIDELDGVLPSRASLDQWGQDSAQRINQFLQELEGVSSRLTGVFVLGATNHLATIDSAVRSRLSYHVEIPLPDYQAREAILSKHFPSKATTTPAAMAKITEGLSGRTLRELCRIAGMIALSEHAEAVTADHFHRAVSRVKDTDNVG